MDKTAELIIDGKNHQLPVVEGSEQERAVDISSLRNTTGVITLDWLVHWLGTPKLQPPWDRIALLGPSVIVGAAYFIYELSQPHETRR